jgi:hypothetical protein
MKPHCLHCNKPLRKQTRTVWIGSIADKIKHNNEGMLIRHIYLKEGEWPFTIHQCRRLSTWDVVGVSKSHGADEEARRRISRFHEWDGKSYDSHYGFFCSNTCAAQFGRDAANAGYRIKERAAAAAPKTKQDLAEEERAWQRFEQP